MPELDFPRSECLALWAPVPSCIQYCSVTRLLDLKSTSPWPWRLGKLMSWEDRNFRRVSAPLQKYAFVIMGAASSWPNILSFTTPTSLHSFGHFLFLRSHLQMFASCYWSSKFLHVACLRFHTPGTGTIESRRLLTNESIILFAISVPYSSLGFFVCS